MVMHIDRFGNIITNLAPDLLPIKHGDELVIRFKDREISCKYVKSYAYVAVGEPLITKGGTGYLELSINRGSAASTFGLKPGDAITIYFKER